MKEYILLHTIVHLPHLLCALTACILCHLPSVYGTFIYHINRPCQLSDILTVILNV